MKLGYSPFRVPFKAGEIQTIEMPATAKISSASIRANRDKQLFLTVTALHRAGEENLVPRRFCVLDWFRGGTIEVPDDCQPEFVCYATNFHPHMCEVDLWELVSQEA